jgi:hypothetical protein
MPAVARLTSPLMSAENRHYFLRIQLSSWLFGMLLFHFFPIFELDVEREMRFSTVIMIQKRRSTFGMILFICPPVKVNNEMGHQPIWSIRTAPYVYNIRWKNLLTQGSTLVVQKIRVGSCSESINLMVIKTEQLACYILLWVLLFLSSCLFRLDTQLSIYL